jgi:hypothetical protein
MSQVAQFPAVVSGWRGDKGVRLTPATKCKQNPFNTVVMSLLNALLFRKVRYFLPSADTGFSTLSLEVGMTTMVMAGLFTLRQNCGKWATPGGM